MSELVPLSPRPSRRTSRTAFRGEPPAADDPLLQFAPYIHSRPRRNSITPDRQRAFISALAATGIVTQAAREIGASLEALYMLRRQAGAEGFAEAWGKAIDLGVARLEDCALQLAIEGEEAPIVSGGRMLGWYKKRNFGFIQFLLRQRRGERFAPRPNYAELRPGHAVYERLKAEWVAAEYGDEEETIREIDEMIERMVQSRRANALLLEGDRGDESEDGDANTSP